MKVKTYLWIEEDENMALCPPSKAAFDGVSEGTHIAVCGMVVDLGEQDGIYGLKHQVYIRFEVPAERVEYTNENGATNEGPKVIGRKYGYTLGEKATLRKDLESWRGKTFLDSELMDDSGKPIYDLSKIVGKACQLAVVKNEKGTSKIASVIGLPKGFPVPALESEPIVYDGNPAVLAKLPDWMQKTIAEAGKIKQPDQSGATPSFAHVNQPVPQQTHVPFDGPPMQDDFDDDIPF